MKKLILALTTLAIIPLAGCQVTSVASIDEQIAADLPTICALSSTADVSFQVIIAAVNRGTKPVVNQKIINLEADAMAAVNSICTDPSKVSAATALQTVAKAYAAVVAQVNAAKAAQVAAKPTS
jgi:hypothetical protein